MARKEYAAEDGGLGTYFVLSQHRRERALAFALAALLALTLLDHFSGHRLNLAVYYALPLLAVAWVTGPRLGVVLALAGGASLGYAEFLARGGDASWAALNAVALGVGYALMAAVLCRLRRALDDAHFQSRKDALTGLVNKSGFYEIVRAEMEVCRRYKRTLSIAYIDCDNFKAVNDRFGHHVGDELLRDIARTMGRKLRSSDLPARLGGDEFAVMLPETSAESCRMVVEMLQQRLLQEMEERGWPVTFSIGIATFMRIPASIDDMVRQADRLMYMVKHASKGAIKQEVFGS